MSLNSTTMMLSLTTGESNTFGNVAVSNENFVHQTQSNGTPLTSGTGSGQATHPCQVTGNATTGGVSLDLTAIGPASGLDGKNRDYSNGGSGGCVKTFILENMDGTNTITVSQPGSNGWTGLSGAATGLSVPIEPGGHIEFHSPVAGKAVSSTNKLLTLTASAGTPQYKLSLVGIAA
jgi:hypothetical protein